MTNTQRIHAFIAAWERRDIEAILVAMSEDVLYENVGLSLSRGRDEVRAFLTPFIAVARNVRFDVHHIAETSDGVVLTERTDVFGRPGGTVSIPVMGRFTLDNRGLIIEWRDYFDIPGSERQLAATQGSTAKNGD